MTHRSHIPRITWQSPLLGPSGYAEVSRNVVAGLMKLEIPVRLQPTWGETASRTFQRREEDGLLEAEIDGYHRYVRPEAPIEPAFLERILKATFRPAGGVHVMLHPPSDGKDLDFYEVFRRLSPTHVARVGYTMFETDRIPDAWVPALNRMDEVWVPTTFGLDVFKNCGIDPEKIRVMPLPADPDVYHPGGPRLSIGRPAAFTFLSIFEWTRRKGWDLLIRAFLEEFGADEDVRLLIRAYQGGGVTGATKVPIAEQVATFLREHGLSASAARRLEFIDRMIPSAEMPSLYRSADAFVLPTRGEGWGQPFLESLLCETPVIATRWSGHLDFLDDDVAELVDIEGLAAVDQAQVADNAFYEGHRWAEPSLADLKRRMRKTFESRAEARRKAALGRIRIADSLNPLSVACRVVEACRQLEDRKLHKNRVAANGSGAPSLNVLFVAREGIFTLPGGDSEVVTSLKTALEARGHRVDFSSQLTDGDGYDLVHVFNLDSRHSLNLALRGIPFVTTPLHEGQGYVDLAHRTWRAFEAAIPRGDAGLADLESRLPLAAKSAPPVPEDGLFSAWASDRLLSVGRSEVDRLRQDEPESTCAVVPLGCRFADDIHETADPELFAKAFGVRDYVLCVGRLEIRKNQLMLLQALKDVDVPVVFVNSLTHQPDYEELCRAFPRRAPTIFTGRVSRQMLLSAYAGAAVHALPSFFELPGLVTLEAAARGRPVVAGRDGAIADYLPRGVHRCDPADPASVREAVLKALSTGENESARDLAGSFTWDNTARETETIYREVLGEAQTEAGRTRTNEKRRRAEAEVAHQAQIASAVEAIEKGRLDDAQVLALKAVQNRPTDALAWFVAGEATLKARNYEAALEALGRSKDLNPRLNHKTYLFLALAEMGLDRPAEAGRALVEGLETCRMAAGVEAIFCDYLARTAAALGDREARRRWTIRRAKLAPADARAAMALVRFHLEDRDVNGAVGAARTWRVGNGKNEASAPRHSTDAYLTIAEGPGLKTVVVLGALDAIGQVLSGIPAGVPVLIVEQDDSTILNALSAVEGSSPDRTMEILIASDPMAIRPALEPLSGRAEVRVIVSESRRIMASTFFQPLIAVLRQDRQPVSLSVSTRLS